ncbi:uncharacterized protein LOC117340063 [Pecten maximus]|uniref:uncharacterized protein LOC117340063 n=1 Tax=Pecten maximus TaxID=6579 RepID=UPI001458E9FE|nr:uncharacterized protein LOC117340063 [Pecten maximus]
MLDVIFIVYILGMLAGGEAAEVCTAQLYSSVWYRYYIYCQHGCCGSYYDRECCASYTGLIIGAVIGVICFIGSIVLFVCLCYHCNKKKSGVVVAPYQNQPGGNVAVVNSYGGQQATYPYQQQGFYQQPNPHAPVGANQVPMTAYPSPVTYGNTNVPPPSYPAPEAGQSNPSTVDQTQPEKH